LPSSRKISRLLLRLTLTRTISVSVNERTNRVHQYLPTNIPVMAIHLDRVVMEEARNKEVHVPITEVVAKTVLRIKAEKGDTTINEKVEDTKLQKKSFPKKKFRIKLRLHWPV